MIVLYLVMYRYYLITARYFKKDIALSRLTKLFMSYVWSNTPTAVIFR